MRPFVQGPAQLKVLDLGIMIGAPFAATMLGDLGAEVIKIEKPGVGDLIRYQGAGGKRLSYRWQVDGRNKRSVTLDIRHAAAQELLRGLARWADVLFENNRPGTLERYGLGYRQLKEVNPRLVYVSVSGYGQTGPYKDRPGYDFTGAAFGGLTFGTGFPDRPPVLPGLAVVDYSAALFAAIGALEAVRRRDGPGGTGRGEWVDIGLYEPMLRIASHSIAQAAAEGRDPIREGSYPLHGSDGGDRNAHGYAYESRDGKFISCFAVTDGQFARLVMLIGDETLRGPHTATMQDRIACAEKIDRSVRAWVRGLDRDEAVRQLIDADIPVSPINGPSDMLSDPHVHARANLLEMQNAMGDSLIMQGVVPKLVDHPSAVRWPGEPLGASNHDVYHGLLGLSDAEIDALRASGVI